MSESDFMDLSLLNYQRDPFNVLQLAVIIIIIIMAVVAKTNNYRSYFGSEALLAVRRLSQH